MKRPLFYLCLFIVIIIGSLNIFGVFSKEKSPLLSGRDFGLLNISAQITDKDEYSYTLKCISVSGDTGTFFDAFKGKKLKLPFSETVRDDLYIGQSIVLTGKFKAYDRASNPGEFDKRKYYLEKDIYGKITGGDIKKVSGKKSFIRGNLYELRLVLKKRIYSVFPEKEASVLCDLTVGDKAGVLPEIKDLYTRNGIAHILSISNLHISILGLGLYEALKRLGAKVPAAAAGTAFFLVFYAFLSGMSIPALRSVLMFLIALLGDVLKRTPDKLTSLALVAVIMLIPDPADLFSCGFLLSFGSVCGIILLYPALKLCAKDIESRIPYSLRLRKDSRVKRFLDFICQSLLISLSISLTTLPVMLYYFFEVPIYSVLLNLFIVPLLSALLISAFLAMIIPGGGFLGTIAYLVLKFYEFICGVFDKLPGRSWNPGRENILSIVIYYFVWLLVILYPKMRKDRILDKKLKGRAKRYFKFVPALAFLLPLIMAYPRLRPNTLIMLDVGQGDSFIYLSDAREVFTFDGGSSSYKEVGKNVIKPALKYYGLSDIKAAFISHPDEDHFNGISEIVKNRDAWGIDIKSLVLPYPVKENPGEVQGLIESCSKASYKKSIPVAYISLGDEFESGRNEFICLHPAKDKELTSTNEFSECFYVSISDKVSLILTGDVEGDGEIRFKESLRAYLSESGANLPDKITILKVAHHGSKYSTENSFLDIADPDIALISAGLGNRYGHPHKELTNRLKERGISILGTQENGAVTIKVLPRRIVIDSIF